MREFLMAAACLFVISRDAAAQTSDANLDALAQPIVNDFMQCANLEVDRTWDKDTKAGLTAIKAMETCDARLDPLREILRKSPFSKTEQGVADEISTFHGIALMVLQERAMKKQQGLPE